MPLLFASLQSHLLLDSTVLDGPTDAASLSLPLTLPTPPTANGRDDADKLPSYSLPRTKDTRSWKASTQRSRHSRSCDNVSNTAAFHDGNTRAKLLVLPLAREPLHRTAMRV